MAATKKSLREMLADLAEAISPEFSLGVEIKILAGCEQCGRALVTGDMVVRDPENPVVIVQGPPASGAETVLVLCKNCLEAMKS